ncbi:DsrE/DsrF/DrsH-like family protein [Peribacillus saganii]|uniref:DsrE/DsrF/DrsH-like family protein n=1 Tax=Peribacillus saganii TaxID=2303992 RepID=UPI002680058B
MTIYPRSQDCLQWRKRWELKFLVFQMTMDVMGLKKQDFVEGTKVGAAVTFLESAKDADVTFAF